MNSQQAVELFVRIAVEAPGLSDEQMFDSLVAHGCPEPLALQSIRFIPIAFARQFLHGMGVSFHDEYWYFAPDGSTKEQSALTSVPVFASAQELSRSPMSKEVVSHVVFRSSEAHAVNNALNAGSKPGDLKLAPVAIFVGQPTEAGAAKAQATIQGYLSKPKEDVKSPWWKLWK
ncbi:hypothetical protein VVD49_19845 [Uliginosibacterium sp. H3]|uniref:Uncharacterized protein n=1 Tax=Uliginosibacterium silvisoli TaxID=3114758 RepID=A0ABU6K9P5_9RHOO|nr:hypothetical protein [Uliginosibacterium sp. H3]